MTYLGGVFASALSIIFFVFIIASLGYLIGAIEIKGISLGTAGVLLVALLFGVLAVDNSRKDGGDRIVIGGVKLAEYHF